MNRLIAFSCRWQRIHLPLVRKLFRWVGLSVCCLYQLISGGRFAFPLFDLSQLTRINTKESKGIA